MKESGVSMPSPAAGENSVMRPPAVFGCRRGIMGIAPRDGSQRGYAGMMGASWMLPSLMESVFMRLEDLDFHCACACVCVWTRSVVVLVVDAFEIRTLVMEHR